MCVSNCWSITDFGIRRFCGIDSPNIGVCFEGLEDLLVRGTGVTRYGVDFAIRHLKRLQQLDCDDELGAFVPATIVRPRSLLLSFSCVSDSSLTIETLLILSANSSFLKCIRHENGIYTNQLATMMHLLSKFHPALHNANPIVSFSIDAVPFLTRFGQSLRNISLHSFDDVDIFFITATCPLLQSINLNRCNFTGSANSIIPVQLRNFTPMNIEEINYDSIYYRRPISSAELLHLFMSPHLTNIRLVRCTTLDDDILSRAFNSHRFKSLKQLTLFSCNDISNEAFQAAFLVESNVLERITIWACDQLSSPNVEAEWNELAKINNWDVEIVFLI